jgi:hypothetical protein
MEGQEAPPNIVYKSGLKEKIAGKLRNLGFGGHKPQQERSVEVLQGLDYITVQREQFDDPAGYAIGVEQFRENSFVTPLDYEFPNKVDRQTFINNLIHSFRVSAGVVPAQELYFDTLRAKEGYNYGLTFFNFLKAGGWNSLSTAERQLFATAANRVDAHSRPATSLRNDNMGTATETVVKDIMMHSLKRADKDLEVGDKSKDDLLATIKQKVVEERQKYGK